MNRLVLAVAAASATLLGAGCGPATHSGPCPNSVTVDWSGGFQHADGSVVHCATIASVDLFINGDASTAVRVPCTDGAAQAVDLPGGTNRFTVEAIDVRSGQDRIVFRAQRDIPFACGDQHAVVTPSEGTLALDYSLPNNACFAPDSHIFSEVRDDIANQLAFVDNTAASPLCAPSPAPAPTYLLPAGNYTLLGVNEYSQSSGGVVSADCTDRAFQIAGTQTTTVPADLVDSTIACF